MGPGMIDIHANDIHDLFGMIDADQNGIIISWEELHQTLKGLRAS